MRWVDRIGVYNVQRRESRRPGGQAYIPLRDPRAFIVHTTEGSSVDSAWSTLNAKGAAPHFIVGEGRIVQTRPLDVQAATLVGTPTGGWYPNNAGWQVECVGFSKQSVHRLTPASWEPLVELSGFMHHELGVPLRRPEGWRDDLGDISSILATDNTRRRSRKAVGFRGFLGHLDIPGQAPTWHWDPGALDYTALFAAVGGADEMTDEERKLLNQALAKATRSEDFINGMTDRIANRPMPDEEGLRRRGWRHADAFLAGAPGGVPPHTHQITGSAS